MIKSHAMNDILAVIGRNTLLRKHSITRCRLHGLIFNCLSYVIIGGVHEKGGDSSVLCIVGDLYEVVVGVSEVHRFDWTSGTRSIHRALGNFHIVFL